MNRHLLRRPVIVVAVVLALASCGGSAAPSTGPGEEPGQAPTGGGSGDHAELERAATEQFEAFLAGDDSAYFDLLSDGCRESFGYAAVVGHLDGRRLTAALDGVVYEEHSVAGVEIEGDGSRATVTLDISGPVGDLFRESALPQTWVFEEGGWHMDDCSDFRPAQGGLEGAGMDRDQPLPYGGVADVSGWLVSLSWIDHDSEELVLEFGGEPATGGNQLVTAQVGITYNGGQPAIVVGEELGFDMVSGDTVYGEETSCDTTEHNLYMDPATQVGPGETAGNPFICREVATGDLDRLLLRVTHLPSGGQWWFDLSQEP